MEGMERLGGGNGTVIGKGLAREQGKETDTLEDRG